VPSSLSCVARIKLPPEAFVPLLIGTVALIILLVFGAALQRWKQRAPGPARMFGRVLAVVLTAASVYFLINCLTNQSDPNNDGTGQLSFLDPPLAGGLAALAAIFWRFGDQPLIGGLIGLAIGVLMFVKPFVWPVIRVMDGRSRSRGLDDPEHWVFLGAGIVVAVVALIVLRRRRS
jgi:hypothetical protein